MLAAIEAVEIGEAAKEAARQTIHYEFADIVASARIALAPSPDAVSPEPTPIPTPVPSPVPDAELP
jgi:hypothetical protein